MTSRIETKCSSYQCPINKHCANYSQDPKFNLVEYDFHLSTEEDEQPVTCDNFEDKIEEEFYK